jgi:hypothetical protein
VTLFIFEAQCPFVESHILVPDSRFLRLHPSGFGYFFKYSVFNGTINLTNLQLWAKTTKKRIVSLRDPKNSAIISTWTCKRTYSVRATISTLNTEGLPIFRSCGGYIFSNFKSRLVPNLELLPPSTLHFC